jgi:hypothetical protein
LLQLIWHIAEEYQHAHEERTQITIQRSNENVTTMAMELITFRNMKYMLRYCTITGKLNLLKPHHHVVLYVVTIVSEKLTLVFLIFRATGSLTTYQLSPLYQI